MTAASCERKRAAPEGASKRFDRRAKPWVRADSFRPNQAEWMGSPRRRRRRGADARAELYRAQAREVEGKIER